MKKGVLVLSGDGMNCERESARAFAEAGAQTTIFHVNELLAQPKSLLDYSILCIPGGFSFGDELRSGKILAEKIRAHVLPAFHEFTKLGGLSIGICNGFQVLIQLGVFGNDDSKREATLATNDHGTFLNQWVELEITTAAKESPWFEGLSGKLLLPMRHKEGRIVLKDQKSASSFRFPLRYVEPVNGSFERSAALLDSSGQILGIMPHPEAATHGFLNALTSPEISAEANAAKVRKIFENAVKWRTS